MHSTLNTLISSSGRLLHSVLTIWSAESLLVLEEEVDLCCAVVWCIVEWSSLL